jgi:HlyD family secretion protein
MKFLLKAFVVLLVLGVGGYFAWSEVQAYWIARNKPVYRLAAVTRGEVIQVVNSTGTVQPVLRVQVGAVVSGPILNLYVDHNAKVRKGDLLAKIDPRIYKANAARDEATCATGRADVQRVTALLQQAKNDEARALKLRTKKADYVSDTEMDRLKFGRISFEAQLALAQAQVMQAEGNLLNSNANLSYTEIRSPVDGVVIDRKIDEGQSLAAQFQTPELFVVAPEMEKRMHVFASVDEADIGVIRQAQQQKNPVLFTVDAYPDDLFEGKIYQIRMNPTTVQNVVTYTIVVEAPNAELKLLPGMTAKLSFQIAKHEKVLKIPNAALRFYPKSDQVRPEDRELLEGAEETPSSEEEGTENLESQRSAMERALARKNRNRRHVWITEDDLLRAVPIALGLNDGKHTELASGELIEGQELVTGIRQKKP